MDAITWQSIQEGLLYVFSPILFWWLVIVAVGGIMVFIGTAILSAVSHTISKGGD